MFVERLEALGERPAPAEGAARPEDGDLAAALHEVSNALTVVLGWLESAHAELPPGAPREAVEVARAHARLGHRIARQAIGAHATTNDDERAALPLARDAVLGVVKEAERRGVMLEIDAQGGDEALLHDASAVLQILLNLLLNAVEFSPAGGVVSLRVRDDGRAVAYEVADQGPGVPTERAATIFSVPESTRRGGAGIGLRHAAGLARTCGGELVLARTGPGACFRLSWPTAAARSGTHLSTPPARSLEGTRVLVVEDDVAVRSLIELALEARGMQVLGVGTPEELARITSRGAILDAALVDLSPIAADVRGALATLRRANPDVPVILISGSAGGVPEGLQGEFAAWVRKPFEMGEVVETLQGVLRV